ncbi:MAG: hypothetical protein H0A76_04450 [Candidatus Thiodubiliella endoseptemdiera]|uniref:Uncharacterized protein n=1 Tax=Candidatus Thiodubiliella endoseptemdiera TaxID=2738886 RepID=A0A853F4N3_9GAMM|nr:hypothetical protein [Candidatus Thiodubiliella endoseptemdiera]
MMNMPTPQTGVFYALQSEEYDNALSIANTGFLDAKNQKVLKSIANLKSAGNTKKTDNSALRENHQPQPMDRSQ